MPHPRFRPQRPVRTTRGWRRRRARQSALRHDIAALGRRSEQASSHRDVAIDARAAEVHAAQRAVRGDVPAICGSLVPRSGDTLVGRDSVA